MKTFSSILLPRRLLLAGLCAAFAFLGRLPAADEVAKPENPPAATPPEQPASVPAPEKATAPEASVAASAPEAPTAPASAEAPVATPAPAELTDEAASESETEEPAAEASPAESAETVSPTDPDPAIVIKNKHRRWNHRGNERVSVGEDATLGEGQKADAVVAVFGTARSSGTVRDAVVSVLGQTCVEGGRVGDAAVSVLGNNYVNAEIGQNVVSVGGNIELGPDAVVHGEVVCIGGELKKDPKAVVKGNVVNFPRGFDFDWVVTWFRECLLKARPLAFDANVLWAWWVALAFLGMYALLALLFPETAENCARTLEERPGRSVVAALLTFLLTPVAYLLLGISMAIAVGFVLLPVFNLALFVASLFGRAVMLLWLGRRLTRLAGPGVRLHPMLGVLLGGSFVLVLYTVPVLGFVLHLLLGFLGLGVVMYTLFLALRRERPTPPPAPAAAVPVASVVAPAAGVPPVLEGGPAPTAVAPALISAVTLPRAGFWIRLAAAILDLAIVGILYGMVQSLLFGFGGSYLLWLTVYTVAMWGTKGTTIGGIICSLKVVRTDDRPLDWTVAVVRALSAYLSLFIGGLGFVWVAFDDDKQSWHDKIAGTTIVKVPKGVSLL